VIDAAARFARAGGHFDRSTRRMLASFGRFVGKHWREPDQGIWEPRSGRRENTHSRLLCWAALDRLLALHADGLLPGAPVAELRRERSAIRRDIEQRAWNAAERSYSARLDGDDVDASLLLLPWYGFEEPTSARMQGTHARVVSRLDAGGGLLYRYRGAESPGEGAFGICSFWHAEHLARGGGSAGEAAALFARLCGYANDVGLFAEEIDPASGAPLGNFPQAFTHVGLVNAALSLERRLGGGREAREARGAGAAAPLEATE
jgi:GH15 family glucan-1,4-alpha-glucosidase